MEGFERLLGAHRGFKEALFSTLISADFLQNLPKFCSEDTRREPKDLWMPLRKSSENPPFTLSLTSRQPKHPKISPKIFSIFWGAYIRCTSKHRPQKPARKRTADPAMDFAGGSYGGFRDTSLMNPAVHLSAASFSEAHSYLPDTLPPRPPRNPKNVPCKATTRQDAPK